MFPYWKKLPNVLKNFRNIFWLILKTIYSIVLFLTKIVRQSFDWVKTKNFISRWLFFKFLLRYPLWPKHQSQLTFPSFPCIYVYRKKKKLFRKLHHIRCLLTWIAILTSVLRNKSIPHVPDCRATAGVLSCRAVINTGTISGKNSTCFNPTPPTILHLKSSG